MMRIDPATHIFLEDELPKVLVPRRQRGKAHWKPLIPGGVAALRPFINSGAKGKFSTSAFYKSWMLAAVQARVEKFNPYKLRHSYATLLRRGWCRRGRCAGTPGT
jgi:integrase